MKQSNDLNCRIERRDDATVVLLGGCIGAQHVAALDRLLSRLPSEAVRIVVDLSGVEHIGSPGIAALVKLHGHARDAGVACCFAGLRPEIRKLFGALGLDRVVVLVASVDDALAARPPTRSAGPPRAPKPT
jgi:anti-anti-sigma factor